MQKLINVAAFVATLSLSLTPAAAVAPTGSSTATPLAAMVRTTSAGTATALPSAATSSVAAVDVAELHQHVERPSEDLAPGQGRAEFAIWLASAPARRADVDAFRAHLDRAGVGDVIPTWQLVRTSSSWRECAAGRFEVAPREDWDNIVTTLRFVEEEVVPAVGPVRALSGYRNASLNACSNGAPASAHRHFHALDLMPVSADVSREQMIRGVCSAHGRKGRDFDTGLGFYSGKRFHVDSSGYRRWGADGRGGSSPCAG